MRIFAPSRMPLKIVKNTLPDTNTKIYTLINLNVLGINGLIIGNPLGSVLTNNFMNCPKQQI